MKKFLFLFTVMISSLFFTTNVMALTLQEQEAVDYFYSHFSDINSYPYCLLRSSMDFNGDPIDIYCYANSTDISYENDNGYYCNSGAKEYRRYIKYENNSFSGPYWVSNVNCSGNYNSISGYRTNFDVLKDNGTVGKEASWSFSATSPQIYTITFNPPRNSTIVVKNSNNEEIQATSQYIYELEAGTYTYSVSNNLYNNLNNISFIVSQDETINITMNERLNNQPIRSIYSQYYNYISELVKDTFGLENPLFLYIVAFIIGFSLITLIRRLIGGR